MEQNKGKIAAALRRGLVKALREQGLIGEETLAQALAVLRQQEERP